MAVDTVELLKQNWPLLLLVAWFGHKWWSARRVRTLLPQLLRQGAVLVDVRSVAEFASAHAPSTLNIPLPELRSRLAEVPQGVPVVVCCASGSRSSMAAILLRKHGYGPVYNAGSWNTLVQR